MCMIRKTWLSLLLLISTSLNAQVLATVEQVKSASFAESTQFISADITLNKNQADTIEKLSGVRVRNFKQKVWLAKQQDKTVGWLIIDEVIGKHEFITYSMALNANGSVKRIEVMEYKETYGGQVRSQEWLMQFVGKLYGAKLKLDEDIVNISGATLSCKHIADGVKRLLSFYEVVLKKNA